MYQNRLKRSNQMVEEVESTSQTLVKKLESELLNDKELIQTQEGLIKELQKKARELEDSRKKSVMEKYKVQVSFPFSEVFFLFICMAKNLISCSSSHLSEA